MIHCVKVNKFAIFSGNRTKCFEGIIGFQICDIQLKMNHIEYMYETIYHMNIMPFWSGLCLRINKDCYPGTLISGK